MPTTQQSNEIDKLLDEFKDATLSSYGDNYSQNEAAKERANKARKSIRRLIERAWVTGQAIGINSANNAYHDLSAPKLGEWLNKELESLEVDYAVLNTKQEGK